MGFFFDRRELQGILNLLGRSESQLESLQKVPLIEAFFLEHFQMPYNFDFQCGQNQSAKLGSVANHSLSDQSEAL